MGRGAAEKPSGLALQVANALAVESEKISDYELERLSGLSDSYIRKRLHYKSMPLTLPDVEALCVALKIGDPGAFIASVEDGSWRARSNVTPIGVSGTTDARKADELFDPEESPAGADEGLAARRSADTDNSNASDNGGASGGSSATRS